MAVAERIAAHGARLVITGRRASGHDLAASLGAHFIAADVTESGAIAAVVDSAAAELGGLDVVVNNAGVLGRFARIADTDNAELDWVLDINLRAMFQVLRSAHSRMQRGGSIINTASVSGHRGDPGLAVYGISKAALISLTRSAALEFAERGIRVNSVSPGSTHSEIWEGNPPTEYCKNSVPMGRMAEGEEVAAAFHFLATCVGLRIAPGWGDLRSDRAPSVLRRKPPAEGPRRLMIATGQSGWGFSGLKLLRKG